MLKRILCVLAVLLPALLCAAPSAAQASVSGDDKALVLSHVEEDYPDWRVSFVSPYGSGSWNGELARHVQLGLYRVEDGMLTQKTLHVLTNPLWSGEEIQYDETDLAPVPLSALTAEKIEALTPEEAAHALSAWIDVETLPQIAEFMLEVKRRAKEVKENARLFSAENLSEEENAAMRAAYLVAVKRLHPDLNPDLPKAAQNLWNEIQATYAAHDWEGVRLLAALVDSVASGVEDFASAPDAITAMREACARLEAKCRELMSETDRIQKSVPFTYKALLDDEDTVKERQNELKIDIAELKAKIKKCEEAWNNG